MKKLVLILAVAFGASMVACSSSEKANDTDNAADANEVVEETVEAAEVAATPDTVRINENQIVVNGDTIENTTWVAAEVVEANAPEE